jgi:hypothetical protein
MAAYASPTELRQRLDAMVTEHVRPAAEDRYARLLDYVQLVMECREPLMVLAARVIPKQPPGRFRRVALVALGVVAVVALVRYGAARPPRPARA